MAPPFPTACSLLPADIHKLSRCSGMGICPTWHPLDDAIGEAFDKTANFWGSVTPEVPRVEKRGARRERGAVRPAAPDDRSRGTADFLAVGLETALRLEAERIAPLTDEDVRDLCASFQPSIVDVVADRLRSGLKLFRDRHGKPSAWSPLAECGR